MRILILGAGFGGLELSSRLSEELGDAVDVVLVDKGDGFVFGFSKLDVMFGRVSPEHVVHRFADIVKPGVTFVQAEVTWIDPLSRQAPGPHRRPFAARARMAHRARGRGGRAGAHRDP